HDAGAEVLGDDVAVLDQPPRDLLALLGLEVEDKALLATVEQQEEEAIEVGVVHVPQPPRPVAMRRPLDLDHLGAEPRQHLRARRPRLVVGEIDDSDAVEGLAHVDLPSTASRSNRSPLLAPRATAKQERQSRRPPL